MPIFFFLWMRSGPGINLSHRFLLEQLLFECTRDLLCNKTVEWLHFMVLSCVWLFVTPGTVAYQAPLSIEFSRQDYQSGLPLPTLGDPPDIGTEPVSLASPALQEDSLSLVPPGKPNSISWEASNHKMCEVLSTEDWNGALHFLFCLPTSYHPTNSHQQDVIHTWTLLLCIPFKHLLRPELMGV